MDNRLANLTWLRTFEAAARLLNFTETGRELGLTQTAVSLHIRSLEASLGSQLFHRAARRLELTEVGQAYAGTVRAALSDISLSTARLFGPETTETLTIRLPVATASLWLAQRLPAFSNAHPEISIRVLSSIWTEPKMRDDVDVEIRLGDGNWPGTHAHKLADETIVPVCAIGSGTPEGLLDGPHIHILGYEDHWARYFDAQRLSFRPSRTRLSVDTTVAALQMVAAGGGYATMLTRFAASAIEAGVGVEIAGPPVSFQQAHYLVRPEGKAPLRTNCQLFEDWLITCFSEDVSGPAVG